MNEKAKFLLKCVRLENNFELHSMNIEWLGDIEKNK